MTSITLNFGSTAGRTAAGTPVTVLRAPESVTYAPVRPRATAAGSESERQERALMAAELGDRFQIVRAIGRGGMGAVYLARDLALHRLVAIKVMVGDRVAQHDERARFQREARLSAQLAHPGIVPLYAFGETDAFCYMVLQYVHGESLADRLRTRGRLAPDEARDVLAALATALEYAHRHGVVHRDLKPENVLLERDTGRAILADFGVAVRHWWDGEMTRTRRAYGTPAYMSPEQALGEPDVDGRSDIYALGVLGYAMLTGRLPFDGSDYGTLVAQHLHESAPPIRSLAPSVPAGLARIVERCLAKQPEQRWRYARDLHAALTGGYGARFTHAARELGRWWRRLTPMAPESSL